MTITCTYIDRSEASVVEAQTVAEDLYTIGVTDGYNGIVPQQSGEDYLLGYIAGERDRNCEQSQKIARKKLERANNDSCYSYRDDF